MADKFQNKYRIPSVRAAWWDYGNQGAYFITICTKNREYYFGEIVENEMQLSEIGKVVEMEWLNTLSIRPDMNLELDEFVVMPNHFHAIIWIGENKFNATVETQCIASLPSNQSTTNGFGPQSKNLSSIVRGFKSSVTTYAKKNKIIFEWQSRFHDHIIRDEKSYQRIRNYIINNPGNWDTDKFNGPS